MPRRVLGTPRRWMCAAPSAALQTTGVASHPHAQTHPPEFPPAPERRTCAVMCPRGDAPWASTTITYAFCHLSDICPPNSAYPLAMQIALATCSNLPDWEVDDKPLHAAFEQRGVTLSQPAWDDASIDWAAFDGVLVRTTWDYTERIAEYLAWAERVTEAGTPLLNPVKIIRWNTDKSYLRDLDDWGIPTIETAWLEAGSEADIAAIMAERDWQRGFIKPAIGASAYHTMRFNMRDADQLDAAQQHATTLLENGHTLLLQPYQPTVEDFGEVSAIYIDNKYTHGVRKVPVPGDYRVQDDYGAHDEPYGQFTDAEFAMFDKLLSRVEHDMLYARIDMLRDEAGTLRIIELELVEPSLFFRHGRHAADALADALIKRVASSEQVDTPDHAV